MPSVVRYRVGGRDYPQHYEPKCKVCKHEMRPWIENQIVYGYGWSVIASHFEDLNSRNISAHYTNGHMPVPLSLKRKIMEDRAEARRLNTETATTPIVDPWSMTQIGMQKGFESMMAGDIEMDMKDFLSFIKLHVEIEERSAVESSVQQSDIEEMLKIARNYMTDEQFENYLNDLEKNPALGLEPATPAPPKVINMIELEEQE